MNIIKEILDSLKKKHHEATSIIFDREKLDSDALMQIYIEYGKWARHYHNFVWISWAFGVSISLTGLFLIQKLPIKLSIGMCIGIIFILICSEILAAGNRKHWSDYKRVQNLIEIEFKLRCKKSNQKGPLASEEYDRKPIRVKTGRFLFVFIVAMLAVAMTTIRFLEH